MPDSIINSVAAFLKSHEERHGHETEFLHALEYLAQDALSVQSAHDPYRRALAFERLAEPDRAIGFRIVWEDDAGDLQVNRGWRVQHSNLLGPYKGGLRFHPTVNLSILKALAFEQTFKNALTGFPLGGAKGGADFDPSGRSDAEIARFCHAFMAELAHHIGPWEDVPAGDIGVGSREIGYLYAAYKRHVRTVDGAITGKTICLGGSLLREEATGYGLIYFLCAMLTAMGEDIEGKRIAISGKGNVARHAARKAIDLGGTVIALSDSKGLIQAKDGFSHDALDCVEDRMRRREPVDDLPPALGMDYVAGSKPWSMECDIALPCATQGEIETDDARMLANGGCRFLAEGANMPLTADAINILAEAGVIQAPGKAANAGGVAVSALEMNQNATFLRSELREVDRYLRNVMTRIHALIHDDEATAGAGDKCVPNYRRGANVAAYRRLAQALVESGAI